MIQYCNLFSISCMFHSIYIFTTKILVKLYSIIKTYLSTLSSPYSLHVYGDILGDTGPPNSVYVDTV